MTSKKSSPTKQQLLKDKKKKWYIENRRNILKKASARYKNNKSAKSQYDKERYQLNRLAILEKSKNHANSPEGKLMLSRKKEKERIRSLTQPSRSMYDGMLGRCYCVTNPRYDEWGARGIRVCDRWLGTYGYRNFVRDMGPRPPGIDAKGFSLFSIDRIDSAGNYEPKNCRWATREEQSRNRTRQMRNIRNIPDNTIMHLDGNYVTLVEYSRNTGIHSDVVRYRWLQHPMCYDWISNADNDNRYYEWNGNKYNLKELGIISGYKRETLYNRLEKLGWPVEQALKISESLE